MFSSNHPARRARAAAGVIGVSSYVAVVWAIAADAESDATVNLTAALSETEPGAAVQNQTGLELSGGATAPDPAVAVAAAAESTEVEAVEAVEAVPEQPAETTTTTTAPQPTTPPSSASTATSAPPPTTAAPETTTTTAAPETTTTTKPKSGGS